MSMMKPTKPATLYAWAERKFGPSKCKDIRFVKTSPKKTKWMGEYEWKTGIITLNLTWIKSSPTLYKTPSPRMDPRPTTMEGLQILWFEV